MNAESIFGMFAAVASIIGAVWFLAHKLGHLENTAEQSKDDLHGIRKDVHQMHGTLDNMASAVVSHTSHCDQKIIEHEHRITTLELEHGVVTDEGAE